MRSPRRSSGAVAALTLSLAAVSLAVAACTTDADDHAEASTTAAPAVDHSEDHAVALAAYESALATALPTLDGSLWGTSGAITGVDTPDGWQVQSHRDSVSGQTQAVGDRQVTVVCAGEGSVQVSVTVRTGGGGEVSQAPVPAPCSAHASTSSTSFVLATGDEGFDVEIVPVDGTVAVVGYVVT